MNCDDFLKSMKGQGHHIPDSIDPYRFGMIDTQSIPAKKALIKGLVSTGELTLIAEQNEVPSNLFASKILSSVYQYGSPCSKHWQNRINYDNRSIMIIEPEDLSTFHEQMVLEQTNDYLLFSMDSLMDHPDHFGPILNSHQPKLVIWQICFDTKDVGRKLSNLQAWIRSCRSKNIGILLFSKANNKIHNHLSPERIVRIWKSPEPKYDYIIDSEFQSELETPFGIKICNNQWNSFNCSSEELERIESRQSKQAKPGVDPSLDFSNI